MLLKYSLIVAAAVFFPLLASAGSALTNPGGKYVPYGVASASSIQIPVASTFIAVTAASSVLIPVASTFIPVGALAMIIMKRPLIKVAAVAAILALGGLGLAYDALARGRLFDGGHFGHGGRFTGKLHDHGRRVSPGRPPAAMKKFPPATSCLCTELSCCDGD